MNNHSWGDVTLCGPDAEIWLEAPYVPLKPCQGKHKNRKEGLETWEACVLFVSLLWSFSHLGHDAEAPGNQALGWAGLSCAHL